MTVLNFVRDTLQKRATYAKTKYELESMSAQTAMDLGLFREDAAKIASKAIYG
ncbi:MAG: hypothetical protein ABJO29_14205 [Yoonia sp.]|uniref:hypothetical protein n=1 Tax=Yoonia sp. TaxID=2212373 RepID=UPI0022066682|nr:hypothetical protein K3729_09615 [Rhodobacteraceae bacterium S2214]